MGRKKINPRKKRKEPVANPNLLKKGQKKAGYMAGSSTFYGKDTLD